LSSKNFTIIARYVWISISDDITKKKVALLCDASTVIMAAGMDVHMQNTMPRKTAVKQN